MRFESIYIYIWTFMPWYHKIKLEVVVLLVFLKWQSATQHQNERRKKKKGKTTKSHLEITENLIWWMDCTCTVHTQFSYFQRTNATIIAFTSNNLQSTSNSLQHSFRMLFTHLATGNAMELEINRYIFHFSFNRSLNSNEKFICENLQFAVWMCK